MKTFSEFALMLEQDVQPRFVGVRVDLKSSKILSKVSKDFGIPNPLPASKHHVTLLYSNKAIKEPILYNHVISTAYFDKFDIFETKEGKRCLVVKLNSLDLQRRHKELMSQTGASYDFSHYLPHITLSYDIGDFDISILYTNMSKIYLEQEYCELLNDLF